MLSSFQEEIGHFELYRWLDTVYNVKGRRRRQCVPHSILQLPCGCCRQALKPIGKSGKNQVSEVFVLLQLRRRQNIWKHVNCPVSPDVVIVPPLGG